MSVLPEPTVLSFSTLDDAAEAREALLATGIDAGAIETRVIEDGSGPVEGNFLIGNGRTSHGDAPEAVRTGREVPYDDNFRKPVYRGSCLLLVLGLDEAGKQRAEEIASRSRGIAPPVS